MTTSRENIENNEGKYLSPFAAKSFLTKGRVYQIDPCPLRTEYQRDRDRIIHCKSFRRLSFKTQVFISPEGDHYRTRLTHTLEVAQIARTIARSLALNEDLTEAIAYGHDLGHTPFGHVGERVLNKLMPQGFHHNEQSLRMVSKLEGNRPQSLNLTYEVRDGILNHTGNTLPSSLEGVCVSIADRIAYINHDIDDALRAGILTNDELPCECLSVLGTTHGERINTMISDLVQNSADSPQIVMSGTVSGAMNKLRDFLFRRVYHDQWRLNEEKKCNHVILTLFHYFQTNFKEMPDEYIQIASEEGVDQAVCDFIACMTDRYALRLYETHYMPLDSPIA